MERTSPAPEKPRVPDLTPTSPLLASPLSSGFEGDGAGRAAPGWPLQREKTRGTEPGEEVLAWHTSGPSVGRSKGVQRGEGAAGRTTRWILKQPLEEVEAAGGMSFRGWFQVARGRREKAWWKGSG